MGVLDKFLNVIHANDDSFAEDEYLDEDYEDEDLPEEQPKRHFLKKYEEEEPDDDYDMPTSTPTPAPTPSQERSSAKQKPKVVRTNTSAKISPMRQKSTSNDKDSEMEVCVIKPRSMEDASEITETLLQSCTVILNLEGLDLDLSQRLIDYSSGSCYAVNGNLQRVSSYIFIITPAGVHISGDFQELLSGAVNIPASGTKFQ